MLPLALAGIVILGAYIAGLVMLILGIVQANGYRIAGGLAMFTLLCLFVAAAGRLGPRDPR